MKEEVELNYIKVRLTTMWLSLVSGLVLCVVATSSIGIGK